MISCSSSARSSGGELGDVALDDLEPVDVVAEHELEAMARVAEVVADDVVAVVEDAARDPGAEAAEHAGDEESLSHAACPGSGSRSSGAPLEQVGGGHDGVRQRADLGNVDLDHVARQQGEVVGRHEPGAREQHATRRDGVVADEPATRSVNVRFIRAVDVSPAKSSVPSASRIVSEISSGASQSSGTYTAGPIAHAAANTLAWGR